VLVLVFVLVLDGVGLAYERPSGRWLSKREMIVVLVVHVDGHGQSS